MHLLHFIFIIESANSRHSFFALCSCWIHNSSWSRYSNINVCTSKYASKYRTAIVSLTSNLFGTHAKSQLLFFNSIFSYAKWWRLMWQWWWYHSGITVCCSLLVSAAPSNVCYHISRHWHNVLSISTYMGTMRSTHSDFQLICSIWPNRPKWTIPLNVWRLNFCINIDLWQFSFIFIFFSSFIRLVCTRSNCIMWMVFLFVLNFDILQSSDCIAHTHTLWFIQTNTVNKLLNSWVGFLWQGYAHISFRKWHRTKRKNCIEKIHFFFFLQMHKTPIDTQPKKH